MSTPKRDTKLIFIVVVGVCLFLVMTYASRLSRQASVNQEVARWEDKIVMASARQHALKAEWRYVQSDAYVEQLAHDEFGMVKPGEELVVIVPADQSADLAAVLEDEQEQIVPFWRQWLNRFGLASDTLE